MTRRRHEPTDKEWLIIDPLLSNKPRGVPWVDDWRVLSDVRWRFRFGTPWAEIPERYGHNRLFIMGVFPFIAASLGPSFYFVQV